MKAAIIELGCGTRAELSPALSWMSPELTKDVVADLSLPKLWVPLGSRLPGVRQRIIPDTARSTDKPSSGAE
jgi:hypothetical protein